MTKNTEASGAQVGADERARIVYEALRAEQNPFALSWGELAEEQKLSFRKLAKAIYEKIPPENEPPDGPKNGITDDNIVELLREAPTDVDWTGQNGLMKKAASLIERLRAASQPVLPTGCVLVPREPTEEMIEWINGWHIDDIRTADDLAMLEIIRDYIIKLRDAPPVTLETAAEVRDRALEEAADQVDAYPAHSRDERMKNSISKIIRALKTEGKK